MLTINATFTSIAAYHGNRCEPSLASNAAWSLCTLTELESHASARTSSYALPHHSRSKTRVLKFLMRVVISSLYSLKNMFFTSLLKSKFFMR